MTVYRLVCKGTIEERILQRAREKEEIHRIVISGGSFKGKSGDLKPKEMVSLLLDDEEIEKKVKIKLEEEEEKVEKEKKDKNKARKREGGPVKKPKSEKKPKLEDTDEADVDIGNSDDPKLLYDFAGDKMGPKKSKGQGAGKRGRPKVPNSRPMKGGVRKGAGGQKDELRENGLEAAGGSLGFYTQT